MMELYVLDPSYDQVGIIDSFKSLLWVNRYTQDGDCELYIIANDENIQLLQRGNFLIRNDDEMMCRIETVEIDTDTEQGDYLIVKGYDVKKVLNQRVVWQQTNFKGTVENFIRKIITEGFISPLGRTATERNARRISNFTLASSKGFTDRIDIQSSYAPIGDKVKELCELFGYGCRVTFHAGQFQFDLYKGVDRSYSQSANDFVVFSPQFDNLANTKYTMDGSEFRSMTLIGGAGEGNNRIMATYDATGDTGIDRYELFVDSDSISNELSYEELIAIYPSGTITISSGTVYYAVAGVNIATLDSASDPKNAVLLPEPYTELLQESGREELTAYDITRTFEGAVEPNYSYKYGVDYNLGDIVQIRNKYGMETSARITEVIESFDENGYSIIPTFEYQEV